ncbi:hypothetical protein LRB11_17365, partial [Ectothiorhodospira haloalkaliphila]|uniref:hypothetical protein n=1 Tax=Ectothiorhodospira haloalkaliphila TaxID=421628 RepID=UPI001EE9959B
EAFQSVLPRALYSAHLGDPGAWTVSGWLAWALALLWAVYRGAPAVWYALSLEAGFWLFLIPVLVIVAHRRMIPFFSSCVLRPTPRYNHAGRYR